MPFTMHGQDLLYINYFPMKFVVEGVWDPYAFIRDNLPNSVYTYYGPGLFMIMALANFVFIKLFHAVSLIKILELAGAIMVKQIDLTAVDFVRAFSHLDLFKNLFLMKSPYLVFDFLTGALLLKLAKARDSALWSYKVWMLNIILLHTAYMVGQFDLIPAFFIIASLSAAVAKRPYLAIASLSLGGATKLFPYILILPACLLLGHNWKKRLSLLLVGGILTISLYLPFYLSSGNSFFRFFTVTEDIQYSGMARWILTGIFVVLYSLLSINAVKDSKQSEPEKKLLYYFLTIGLLTCAVIPVKIRYFVSITPLLALVFPQHKRFATFMLFVILIVAFLRLDNRYVQWGLFAPLNPEYFVNLPSIQEIVGRFVNIEVVYKIMARVSLLTFFVATGWAWRFKEARNEA